MQNAFKDLKFSHRRFFRMGRVGENADKKEIEIPEKKGEQRQ